MSDFLLDTDILSLYQRSHPAVVANVQKQASGEVAISVISVQEQLDGWRSLMLRARTRAQTEHAYQMLHEGIIAAIALEAGATVVTRNRRDFGRIPGVSLVDWSV
jgi:tRNA(fMet)-specific endonuclease VapC